MKKFFCILILSLCIFSTKVFAADVLIMSYVGGTDRQDRYVQTDKITEDVGLKIFTVPVKIVFNDEGELYESYVFIRRDNARRVKKMSPSEKNFKSLNSNEIYQRMFDAAIPYCELAQMYPR